MTNISHIKKGVIKKLYFEKGLSAREIANHFSVGVHAVYYFMKRHGLQRRDHFAANHICFLRKPLSYKLKQKLSRYEDSLKIAGIMLYWGEGTKQGNIIDFTNSDVEMCKVFIRFLRKICGVDELRLRGYLYCHDNQDPERLMGFWSRELMLPRNQFSRPHIRQCGIGNKENPAKRMMKYGLLHVRYGDCRLLNQINEWIEEYKTKMGR